MGRELDFLCAQAQDNSCLETSNGAPCALEGRRRDGQPFWFEAMVSPVLGGDGVAGGEGGVQLLAGEGVLGVEGTGG